MGGGEYKEYLIVFDKNDLKKEAIKIEKSFDDMTRPILCGCIINDDYIAFGGEEKKIFIYNKSFEPIF